MIHDLILKNRSYRRFYQSEAISSSSLMQMVDNARLSPSGRNAQSFKYILSNTPTFNEKIFPCLSWAAYLKDWSGPAEGERPSAYIVMLNDTGISTNYFWDHGIAVQSILLTAVDLGYGGCIIASIQKEKLRTILNIPEKFEIVQVIALGKPKEIVVIEEIKPDGDFKYWRDDTSIHHVPKRKLSDIILSELSDMNDN